MDHGAHECVKLCIIKVKVKVGICYSASYMSQTRDYALYYLGSGS